MQWGEACSSKEEAQIKNRKPIFNWFNLTDNQRNAN